MCQEGYEGEDCTEVTGCKNLNEQCKKIKTECVFDKDAPGKAVCKCENDFVYDRENNECQGKYIFFIQLNNSKLFCTYN